MRLGESGSDRERVEITAGLLCAADVPVVEHCTFLIFVFVNLCSAQRIMLRRIYVFKPDRLISAANTANREVTMGAHKSAEIDFAGLKCFHGLRAIG